MKSKDIFCLVVRLLGLVFVYLAARNVPFIWEVPAREIFPVILTTVFFGVVARWLVGGAPRLMNLAYPDPENAAAATETTAPQVDPLAPQDVSAG